MLQADVYKAIKALGWSEDRYGNFKANTGKVRIKLGARKVRIERLHEPEVIPGTGGYTPPKEWLMKASAYYKDVVQLPDGRIVIETLTLKRMEPSKVYPVLPLKEST